jgi:uncharacterized protein (TIGR00251 family)
MKNYRLHDGVSGSAITIRMIPQAKQNEITGIMDDGTIKVRISAPLENGKANHVLINYLSNIFDVNSSQIEIVAGQTGKLKLVAIEGLRPDELENIVQTKKN